MFKLIKNNYNNTNTKRYFSLSFSSLSSDYNNNYIQCKDDYLNGLVRKIIMINDKQRNVLSLDSINYLKESILNVDTNKYRLILITAEKRQVFSSGHNLKELILNENTNNANDYYKSIHKLFNEMNNLCKLIRDNELPVIAQVYGLCAAAGLQLALSCDLIVASNKSTFSTPGVKYGIFCSTPGVPLTRCISPKISMKMLLTGDTLTAHEALQHGLISELINVDKDDFNLKTNELIEKINLNSKHVVQLGKKCIQKQMNVECIDSAYEIASEYMCHNLKLIDTQNGLKSFSLKQKPQWSNNSHLIDD